MRSSRRRFLTRAASVLGAAFLAPGLRAADTPALDTLARLRREMDEAPLAMRFTGTTADECRAWQKEFAAKLRSLLGPFASPARWQTTVQKTAEFDDHRREELLLTADGFPALPVYLLLPRPKTGRRSGILALHGHGRHGHHPVAGRDDLDGVAASLKSANYDYGRQLARRGYAVAVPCFTPFGVRAGDRELFGKADPCGDTFVRMQLLGKLLIAENLRDALWALELLAKHEEVDGTRLGCIGLSYGGRMTMLTTALEPRIKVAAVSGALNLMQERARGPYGCGAQIIPGLLRYGDTAEIGSLIAPRPCVWEAGLRDTLIPAKQAEEMLTRMRKAYKALDAADNLHLDRFEGGHVWNGKVAVPLIDKVLGA